MSEALSSDAVKLDAISPIGNSEPERATSELPTEAITMATAQPEPAPELVTVAQPADEVLHVELASASVAPQAGPQAEVASQALAAGESAVVADAQPATIMAQELTAVATPAMPIVEEAARLPSVAALDGQSAAPILETVTVAEVSDLETGATAASPILTTENASVERAEMLTAPVIGLEALTATEAATPAIALTSSDQVIAQAEALPVAEMVAVQVEPAHSGLSVMAEHAIAEELIPVVGPAAAVTPATHTVASAELFPDLAAPAPSAARTTSSAGRFVPIALIVLLLLAAGVIAFLMLSGTNPLAHFGL